MAAPAKLGNVCHDRCNGNLNFEFKDPVLGKKAKVCVTTKSDRDPDDLARIVILVATRCEQGIASLQDLLSYRNELLSLDAAGLESAEQAEQPLVRPRFLTSALELVGQKYAFEEDTKPTEIRYESKLRSLLFTFKTSDGRLHKPAVKVNAGRPVEDWICIMTLLQAECAEGATLDRLQKYREELLEFDADRLNAAAAQHRDKATFAPGLHDEFAAEYEVIKQIGSRQRGNRCGLISYDNCNKIYTGKFLESEDDKKGKKITVSTKSQGAEYCTKLIAILAHRCNEGASAEELYSYRVELLKLDDAALEALVQEKMAGIELDTLFTPGSIERCRQYHAEKAADTTAGSEASARPNQGAGQPQAQGGGVKRKKVKDPAATERSKKKHKKNDGLMIDSSVLQSMKEKGGLAGAFVLKGRDASQKHSNVNGVYTEVPEGCNGAKAYKNIRADVSRVIHYHAKKGRWKVSESLGEKSHCAFRLDSSGKGSPFDVDPSQPWQFYQGKEAGYVPDLAVKCVPWDEGKSKASADKAKKQEDKEHASSSSSSAASDSESEGKSSSSSEEVPVASPDSDMLDKSVPAQASEMRSESNGLGSMDAALWPLPRKACAKMMVRVGRRCACHFSFVLSCPARAAIVNGDKLNGDKIIADKPAATSSTVREVVAEVPKAEETQKAAKKTKDGSTEKAQWKDGSTQRASLLVFDYNNMVVKFSYREKPEDARIKELRGSIKATPQRSLKIMGLVAHKCNEDGACTAEYLTNYRNELQRLDDSALEALLIQANLQNNVVSLYKPDSVEKIKAHKSEAFQ